MTVMPGPTTQVLSAATPSPLGKVTPSPARATGRPPSEATPAQPSSGTTPGERLLGSYVQPQEFSQYCSTMQQYGVRFTWLALAWNGIEPVKGMFRFERFDPVIQGIHNCGLDLGVHILSRSNWATLPPPASSGRAQASMPPKDMNDYYNFIFQVASHYKGVISRYSIENEAHASVNWGSTPESYFQLLATAYRAVHAADPNALVEDAALSSSGLGMLIANDMLKAGKQQDAVNFVQHYYAHYAPGRGKGEPIIMENLSDLQGLINQSESQRLLQWTPLLFQNHDFYDVIQLHYFGPWDDLPMVMDWVHTQLKNQGGDKPIDFWEFGYGWDNQSTYDPQAHAQDEPKYLATAIGEGALRALSWQFTDFAAFLGHPGLFTANGPRPAAQSFKITAEKINGTISSQRLDLGPGAWGYRFDKNNGTVYVVWSAQPAKVSLPINAQTVTVTDISGQITTADPKTLDAGVSPIFVEAR